MGRQQGERVRAAGLAEVVQSGVLLGHLAGDKVKLRRAEVREESGEEESLLVGGELRHPAQDRLQPPLELQRLHPGLAEGLLELLVVVVEQLVAVR